jgi:tetratricopeptide (TPR) repeat protein
MIGAAVLVAGATLVAGCGDKNQDPAYRSSGGEAEQFSMDKSKFELAKDPPYTAQTHYAAGLYAESEGRRDQAIGQFQEALKLDPRHEPSLYQLAVNYTAIKQYDLAVETWQKYIKVTREPAIGYSNLGFTFELSRQFDQAEAAYQKAISIDPKSEAAHVKYGLMLARHDKMEDAIKQWNVVLTPAQVQYNVGAVQEARGRRNEARVAYEAALALKPDFTDAQKRLDRLNGSTRLPPGASKAQSNTAASVER